MIEVEARDEGQGEVRMGRDRRAGLDQARLGQARMIFCDLNPSDGVCQ